mgnify:FL=1|jgi:hypothetical protein|tara:strand:- start:554 stop:754 length:201 start_codon:yes stop_codon:yes gene_type:complete
MKNNKVEYLKLIKNLSDDIGISQEETKSLVDIALSSSDLRYVNYEELKDEITTFLVINIFSLICKL